VPPSPIQELRDLTRTRKQLMREIVPNPPIITGISMSGPITAAKAGCCRFQMPPLGRIGAINFRQNASFCRKLGRPARAEFSQAKLTM
jgi:hypothetical protein